MSRYLFEKLDGRGGRGGRDGRQGVRGTGRYGIGGSQYSGRDRREEEDDDDDYMDERSSRYSDSAPYGRGGQSSRRSSQRGGQYRDSRGGYGRRDMNYDDYDSHEDMEYNYDMRKKPLELSKKDLKKWEKELENSDGSHGGHFHKDQIIPLAKQFGVKFDDFTEEEFVMAVNMMYADYSLALQEASVQQYNKPELYIHLAKAFLCDEDFDGEPYEKLALYYYAIVDYEE